MASIVGKTIKGQTYYYLREVARVSGKVKVVSQRYLGKAADIEAAIDGATSLPDKTRHLAFGDVAATWAMLKRLQVIEIVDEVLGPRRCDAGASVGTYIALAVLNRVCDPCSKAAFASWWSKTACERWVRLGSSALDHRRFWDAMDSISTEQLKEIERRIVSSMLETFEVELSGVALDMTNFATWIDSANDRAPIAQRGHSKQKRADLRIVGLGLVVSAKGGLPLVSHPYPGNRPDVTQFPIMVEELARRFEAISGPGEAGGPGAEEGLTVVFDAGQNSEDNYELLEASPFHFVSSLPPSDHPDLLDVAKSSYRDLEAFPGLSAYETTKVVYGVRRRIVLCHSSELHAKQSAGFEQTLAKARRQLGALQARLGRGRCRKSKEKVQAEIEAILKPRWVSAVISTTLSGDEPSELRLTWRSGRAARAALEERIFGKRILFTDKAPEVATTEQVVAYYRSQEAAEGDFRQMKDTKVVSFSPMFHFTEQKIRVHAFYCVLALMVVRLMVAEAERAGIAMSVRELLDCLSGIEETLLLYQGERGRPRARRTLTEMDSTARRLYDLFGLDAYAPRT